MIVHQRAVTRGRDVVLSYEKEAMAAYVLEQGYDFAVAQGWGWTRSRVFGSHRHGDLVMVGVIAGPGEPILRRTDWMIRRLARKLGVSEVVRVS